MQRKRLNYYSLMLSVLSILAIALMPANVLAAKGAYLYSLSNFNGIAPFNWVRMHIDDTTGEVYVADPTTQSIVIFNNVGMQIYDFDTSEFGSVVDFIVDNEGNFLLLNFQYPGFPATLIKCNYRGEFVSKTEFKGFPPELVSSFSPDRFFYTNNR